MKAGCHCMFSLFGSLLGSNMNFQLGLTWASLPDDSTPGVLPFAPELLPQLSSQLLSLKTALIQLTALEELQLTVR